MRLPGGSGPHPVVVVIHGGFWRVGYDRGHIAALCAALAARGYLTAAIEYRRVGAGRSGWPATFDDVAAVLDTLPDLLGGHADRSRVVLLGHSAGGHLALWSAGRHRLSDHSPWLRRDPVPIRGVVSLAGVADLALAFRLTLGGNAVGDLLGGRPQDYPDRYAATDPSRLVPLGVPTVLLHGSADRIVPIEVSRSYAKAAADAGDSVRLLELPGVEHFGLIDPLSPAWHWVIESLADLTMT
ncbi:MAG: alpha/beta hydrolase family protein [Pseudonocardiaceae bacterium]